MNKNYSLQNNFQCLPVSPLHTIVNSGGIEEDENSHIKNTHKINYFIAIL